MGADVPLRDGSRRVVVVRVVVVHVLADVVIHVVSVVGQHFAE